ncbi:helix-turn-helix transcriptional regulator [bacterium]|nr:helix-turn-helix transcriptional regulator [bacterium]
MNKDEILKEFGKNLRAERNRSGYSQDGLADEIGICAGKHIGTIERGETNPTLTTIVALMKKLNISFDKLFDITKF